LRNIVITGSASGIGAACKAQFQTTGDRVVGIDLSDADIAADLSTQSGRDAAIAATLAYTEGKIDGLILSAGLSGMYHPGDVTLSVNYFGSVELLDALRPAMEGRPNACAIGLVSNSSQFDVDYDDPMVTALLEGNEEKCRQMVLGLDRGAAYRFSKHALARAIRRRASIWGPLGVRINAIVPGVTETPMVDALKQDPEVGPLLDLLPIPVGRKGNASEMAKVIAFLLSEDASYIHGTMVWVDGGTDAAIRPDLF
jgi:NAD(P)-dependent dehydrogenase (short-subunit alcohol dehydrogenase family)